MFSPRKTRKTIDKQSMLLLTETSYDKSKSAELHKHVTEVSDDESLGATFKVPADRSPVSPSPRSITMKQRFIRLGRKKESIRDPSSLPTEEPCAPTGLLLQSDSPPQEKHPNASEDAARVSHLTGELGKDASYDTMVAADDSSSTASTTIQNSFSMQSGGSIHDVECSNDMTLPDPCILSTSPVFQSVDNVVSVHVVDGFAQMLVTPLHDDLSSDDDESASDEDLFVSPALVTQCDLDSLFVSKHKSLSTLTDEATSASFEFSTVNWRTASPDRAIAATESVPSSHDYQQAFNKEKVRQTYKAGPDSDGDDTFDYQMPSIHGVEDSFDLHSQSSDFDLLDVSFAEEMSSSIRHNTALVLSRESSSGSLFERPNSALAKSMSHSSLSDNANAQEAPHTSDTFNLSFNFTTVDWIHPPQDEPEANGSEIVRKAPQRSGSHLSQESQQRIKEYLTKDRKKRPSSNACRSVGYLQGQKSKARSPQTTHAPVTETTPRGSHTKTGRTRSSIQSTKTRSSSRSTAPTQAASVVDCTSHTADFIRARPRAASQKMVEPPSPRRSSHLSTHRREGLPGNGTRPRRRRASANESVGKRVLANSEPRTKEEDEDETQEPRLTDGTSLMGHEMNPSDKAASSKPGRKVRPVSASTETPKGRYRRRSESRARSSSQPPNVGARKPVP